MRLIDADELINQGYEIVVDGLQYDTCNKSIDIDAITTAYSVDKVIEELEMEMKASSGYSAERVSAFSRAIEIVKHGDVIEAEQKLNEMERD